MAVETALEAENPNANFRHFFVYFVPFVAIFISFQCTLRSVAIVDALPNE